MFASMFESLQWVYICHDMGSTDMGGSSGSGSNSYGRCSIIVSMTTMVKNVALFCAFLCAFVWKLSYQYNNNESRWSYWCKRALICITRIMKDFKEKTPDKNTRKQKSCPAYFLLHQGTFCLHKSVKNSRSVLLRQEICIERMAKESWLITKKIKNLERREAESYNIEKPFFW